MFQKVVVSYVRWQNEVILFHMGIFPYLLSNPGALP
jgi:hypothetical protein